MCPRIWNEVFPASSHRVRCNALSGWNWCVASQWRTLWLEVGKSSFQILGHNLKNFGKWGKDKQFQYRGLFTYFEFEFSRHSKFIPQIYSWEKCSVFLATPNILICRICLLINISGYSVNIFDCVLMQYCAIMCKWPMR